MWIEEDIWEWYEEGARITRDQYLGITKPKNADSEGLGKEVGKYNEKR